VKAEAKVKVEAKVEVKAEVDSKVVCSLPWKIVPFAVGQWHPGGKDLFFGGVS
jgi:hypothetical protein